MGVQAWEVTPPCRLKSFSQWILTWLVIFPEALSNCSQHGVYGRKEAGWDRSPCLAPSFFLVTGKWGEGACARSLCWLMAKLVSEKSSLRTESKAPALPGCLLHIWAFLFLLQSWFSKLKEVKELKLRAWENAGVYLLEVGQPLEWGSLFSQHPSSAVLCP